MITDIERGKGMDWALLLWKERRLGAEPFMLRVGKEWVPDSWEMQPCCLEFIKHHGTALITSHCREPLHIAQLCGVDLNHLLTEIDKLLRREGR